MRSSPPHFLPYNIIGDSRWSFEHHEDGFDKLSIRFFFILAIHYGKNCECASGGVAPSPCMAK